MVNGKKGVHDPTIIQVEDNYYLFSTDTTQPETSGVPIRVSTDLINWEYVQTALPGVPVGAAAWTKATGLWAPEVVKVGSEYRMYYSASTFGSTQSMIGLAVAPDPLGPWVDQGEVVKTSPELAEHNAIDGNLCFDRDGKQWLVYGSFFGGIMIAPIDPVTGKFSHEGYGQRLAIRSQSVEGAVEGPFIKYNAQTDEYFLFLSYDSLNDFYNIRVGKAKSITGPYLDFNGNDLTDLVKNPEQVGTKILGGYQFQGEKNVLAPGHNSIFTDLVTAKDYIVHHAREKPFSADFSVQIRPLFWLANGWPVVAPVEFSGPIREIKCLARELTGRWEIVVFDSPAVKQSEIVTDIDQFILAQGGEFICYQSLSQEQLFLTGMTNSGIAYFAKQLSYDKFQKNYGE